MISKLCPTCKEVKPADMFSHSSTTKDGFNWQCSPCHKERMRKQHAFNKVRPKLSVDQKRCSTCRDVKSTDEFNRNGVTADGYNNVCRVCESKYKAEREERYRSEFSSGKKATRVEEKICSNCGKLLPAIQFSTALSNTDGLKYSCKVCDSKTDKLRLKNPLNRLKSLLRGAKARALKLGLEFSIKAEHLIIPDVCPALGIPIVLDGEGRSDSSPSLDRIRNDIGYVDGNVVVVSSRANRLKSDATVSELVAIASFYEGTSN